MRDSVQMSRGASLSGRLDREANITVRDTLWLVVNRNWSIVTIYRHHNNFSGGHF